MLSLPADVLKKCIVPRLNYQSLEAFHRVCRRFRALTSHEINQLTFQKLYGIIAPSESQVSVFKLKERFENFLTLSKAHQLLCFDAEGIPFFKPLPFENCPNLVERWQERVKFYKGEHYIQVYEQARQAFNQMDSLRTEIEKMPCSHAHVGQHLRDMRKRLTVLGMMWKILNGRLQETEEIYQDFISSLGNIEKTALKIYTQAHLPNLMPRFHMDHEPEVSTRVCNLDFVEGGITCTLVKAPFTRIKLGLEIEGKICFFSIARIWQKEGQVFKDRKYPDKDSFLQICDVTMDQEGKGELKNLQLQLMIEIFLREDENMLEIWEFDSYFYLSAGFSLTNDHEQVKKELVEARKQGIFYPPPKDFGSCFYNLYKKNGKLYNRRGEESMASFTLNGPAESWTSIIAKNPLLKGSGPFLPIFFNEK